MGLTKHQCVNCGNIFENYFDNAKFCNKSCMKEYRKNNSKLANRICSICGKTFNAHNDKQIHCSKQCAWKSRMVREHCICEYCGQQFDRIKSEVNKNKHHYCSNDCRKLAHCWNEKDIIFLINHYGVMSYNEIGKHLIAKRTYSEIKRKAQELKITKNNKWTTDEENLLKEIYSTQPLKNVLMKFPNKTKYSIIGKAHTLGLTTFFYNDRIYSKAEDKFIMDNYRKVSALEISNQLKRSYSSVQSRIKRLGLLTSYPKETKYTDIKEYIRKHTKSWRNKTVNSLGNKCQLTGATSNIVLHHIRSFNLLVEELFDGLGFDYNKSLGDYAQKELDYIVEQFLILQETYKEYICITEEIHKKFHTIYGYGCNTKEQWEEFISQYKS